jgi:hypothetical protein
MLGDQMKIENVLCRILSIMAILGFVCYLITEGPDYFGERLEMPSGLPDFLYPWLFPIFLPLGFIVGFALILLIWEVIRPTTTFKKIHWMLIPFALLSMGWGIFGIYNELFVDPWSVGIIPHLNEAGIYALIFPLFLLFQPSRKILIASLIYTLFSFGSAVIVMTIDGGYLEEVFSWVGAPTTWENYFQGRMTWGIYQDTISEASILIMTIRHLIQWNRLKW